MNIIKIKYNLREKLSKKQFYVIYTFFRFFKNLRFYFYGIINYFLLFLPNLILKNKNKYFLIFSGWGAGDLLALTSVVNYYSKKGEVVLVSSDYDVFKNFKIKKINPKNNKLLKIFLPILNCSFHSNIIGAFEIPLNINKEKIHLREALLSKRKDVCNNLFKINHNAIIKFNNKEIKSFSKKYNNIINDNYGIIIAGSYPGGLCQVKNWGIENMQKVIDRTYKDVAWIQVGTIKEPKINKSFLDLRGKTKLRELFFIVSKAKIIVTTEGLLTHLSSAFNIPCITIYSGYHYPEISSYKNVIPIQPSPLPECAYCWTSPCLLYDKPLCLKNIKVNDVLKQIKKKLDKNIL